MSIFATSNNDLILEVKHNRADATVSIEVKAQTPVLNNWLNTNERQDIRRKNDREVVRPVFTSSSGLEVTSNIRPFYSAKEVRLYLRGSDAARNSDVVNVSFNGDTTESAQFVSSLLDTVADISDAIEEFVEAEKARNARPAAKNVDAPIRTDTRHDCTKQQADNAVNLVSQLFDTAHANGCLKQVWDIVTALRSSDADQNIKSKKGMTTSVRRWFLDREQAKVLNVTDHKTYGAGRKLRTSIVPFKTGNVHFDEHMYYVQQVLNTFMGGVKAPEAPEDADY